MIIGSAVSEYLSVEFITWFYVITGYLVIVALISAAAVVIIFKLSKKSAIVNSEIFKAEKMLLYHTMFVTFWMTFGKMMNVVMSYLQGINQETEVIS